MHVLVTGHLGYLGTVITAVLEAEGHDVVGLDTGLFADCVLGPPPADPAAHAVDVRDATAAHLRGIDAVVHLAALSNDPLGHLAPDLTHEINHRASVRLATLARDCGVRRFVFASSCSVYGASGDDHVGEDAPLRPLTPYAVSKVRVEEDLAGMAGPEFSPVFLRNATAFGFSSRPRTDIVVNNLVAGAVLTGEVRVLSDGSAWRPLVHVRDIAAAAAAALTAPREALRAMAFNVGSAEHNLTVADIAAQVTAGVPGARLTIVGETGRDTRSYRVDFSRIHQALPGFVASNHLGDGVAELHDRFRRLGLTEHDAEHRFNRLARLTTRRDAGELGPDFRPAG